MSVLTDEKYFQGHDQYLVTARKATVLPVLRKDFIVDPYQIYEARCLEADCVLLIASALDDTQLQEFHSIAIEIGMDALVEVHDEVELIRALKLKTALLGVNNRNLKTMVTDLGMTERLASIAPSEKILVSESGLRTNMDLSRMARVGARCFLIGESIMIQTDVENTTRALLSEAI